MTLLDAPAHQPTTLVPPLTPLPARWPVEPRTNLWVRCENRGCGHPVYTKELERNLRVCPWCNHHYRLSARERVAQLADRGSFREFDAERETADPLRFVSLGQSYRDKVRQTQQKTALRDAILCGSARIGGLPVELAVMDFGFLGGSMGSVVGEKLVRAIERAIAYGRPVVTVSCSGGARMHEGLVSLIQMARTSAAVARLHRARHPLFSVLTDPTTGGVTASFAGLGDVLIAEAGALIGFAGPRVIEQVTKQKLPPDAQRAERLLQGGMVDIVAHRRDLRTCLAALLQLFTAREAPDHAER
jgi:acetyl-CoA carboxylase carboxyl transferase subunit beta